MNIKNTMQLFALVILFLFSACKKSQMADDIIKQSPSKLKESNQKSILDSVLTSRQITKEEYLDRKNLIISGQPLPVLTNNYKIHPLMTVASTNSLGADDDGAFDVGASEDVYYTRDDSNTDALSYGNFVRYRVRVDYFLPRRKVGLYVQVPIRYSTTLSQINPTTDGPSTAYLLGEGLGIVKLPLQPTVNVYNHGYSDIYGNCSGDLVEERTIINTSDGKVLVKGGLEASGVQLGSEISAGITIVKATNSVGNYRWDFNFTLDIRLNGPENPSRFNWTGAAHYTSN